MALTGDVGFSEAELLTLLKNIDRLTHDEAEEVEAMVSDLQARSARQAAYDDLIAFCKYMQPDYKVGRHHRILADQLMALDNGAKDRVAVNLPPRHGKSQLVSIYYPAWYIGRNPGKKVMMVSHTTDLAVDFGRKVRNLMNDTRYQEIFAGITLAQDSKSAGRWSTNHGSEYYATGVGSSLAGRGADMLIIDDPHALEINTPIPTPNGFVAIQDLKEGDFVFGPDGEPVKVLAKSEVWHDRELYSVTTDDGEEVLCDAQHLWGVNSDTNLGKAKVYNFTAEYLSNWPKANRPVIPRHQPVQYPARSLPIDPWVLGAWLGDGTTSGGRMTACPADQPYMLAEFAKAGYKASPLTKDGFTFTAYGLMPQLRTLGVLNNKHIPEEYMVASTEQRMALLQGLIDTDGSVAASGQAGFYNCNLRLVTQVKELLHSLGVKCAVRTYLDTRGRHATSQPNHRVMFRLADCARMPRKLKYTRTPTDKRSRSIEVENTGGRGSVQCITVDRADGLFLAGRGYVVTHNSEQDVLAGNFEVFDKAYQWFTFGARTRLMPGGCVALVQCMTGDTPVLMQDGREKPLRDIHVGDIVATYDDGRLGYEKVVNHRSNGIDCIYAIKMTSGIVVRANERHPFLVRTQTGETTWTRLKDLRTGDSVVSLKDAAVRLARQPSGASAGLTSPPTATTGRTPTRPGAVWVTGGSTWARAALSKAVMPLRKLKGFAQATITKACGHLERGVRAPKTGAGYILNTGTGLVWRSTTGCWSPKRASVLSASNPPASTTPGRTGTTNCASITATREGMSEPCSATTAISPSGMQKLQRPPLLSPSICDFTEDQIESITPAGREEVFDVQINRTENFIANGLVSHNTRWHLQDLTGRVVRDMTQNEDADQYEVVEFPAIMEIKQPDGTTKERALWPAFFDLAALRRTQASMPTFQWNAQYQQDPTAEGSALIKRDWWRIWTETEPPEADYVIMALDAAAEQKEQADYTAITTWGVFFREEDRTNNLILLDAVRRRVEYPELRVLAKEMYDRWEPDAFIVEKKSSGVALFQELRRTGMMLQEFTPHRGTGNKFARMQAVADIVKAGIVWVPTTRWAEELVEEIASFPVGAHDDLADTAVMALTRFRQGGFIRLPTDEEEDEAEYVPKRAAYY